MNKKVIIFIGEGNSEIAFFKEFIKRLYYVKLEDIKTEITYQIGDNFIIFAHPIIGTSKHLGGDKTFLSPKTYIDINKKIISSKYNFPNISEYEFTYFCLTDKDKIGAEKKLDGVEKLIGTFCKSYIGRVESVFAVKEIETWFLSGLGKDFLENYPEVNKARLMEFYGKKDLESIDDTKELLENVILKDTTIGGSREYTGREFGKYIDINQAKSKSPSFKAFVYILENIFK